MWWFADAARAWAPTAWQSGGGYPADQALAAQWYVLWPATWGWVTAATSVAATAWLAWRLWERPLRPELPPDVSERASRAWLAVILAGATALYLPGAWGTFSRHDDYNHILWSPRTQTFTLASVWETLTTNPGGLNQELMFASFQVNWAFAGDRYWAWYLPQLVIVLVALGLAFPVFVRVTGHRGVALLGVAALATRPILAELLCWLTTRGHLMGLVFALGCVLAYGRWRDRRGWGWYGAALALFCLAQLAKPLFLYLPGWLVLLDWWEGRRSPRDQVDKVPFVALTAAFVAKMLRDGAHRVSESHVGDTALDVVRLDLALLLEYAHAALVPYPTGLIVPHDLAPGWLHTLGVAQVLPFGFAPLASLVVLLAAGSVVIVLSRRGLPRAWLVALAAVGTLATVMNFPSHVTVFAYRYLLPGHVVVCVALAWVVLAARSRYATWAAVAWLTLSAHAFDANRRAWATNEAYWTRNAAYYPYQAVSHYYAGRAWQHAPNDVAVVHLALHHLETARKLGWPPGQIDKRLGDAYYKAGDKPKAAAAYQRYFRGKPHLVTGFYAARLKELGVAL